MIAWKNIETSSERAAFLFCRSDEGIKLGSRTGVGVNREFFAPVRRQYGDVNGFDTM